VFKRQHSKLDHTHNSAENRSYAEMHILNKPTYKANYAVNHEHLNATMQNRIYRKIHVAKENTMGKAE